MFGPNAQSKAGANGEQGAGQSLINAGAVQNATGQNTFNTGSQLVGSAANYDNTLLNGNRANTTAQLAPDINRIRDQDQNSLQTASSLMPRGGGRTGTLFQQQFAPQSGINGLYNNARTAAAGQIGALGQGQQSAGAGLMGIGNSATGAGGGLFGNLANYGLNQQKQQFDLQSLFGQGTAGLFGF